MTHDFAAQKAETFATFAEITDGADLPDTADIDFFFLPDSEESDWRPLADALSRDGYVCEWADAEEDDGPYLVATLPDQPLSAGSLWAAEEVATRAALDHGFSPDGWGFES